MKKILLFIILSIIISFILIISIFIFQYTVNFIKKHKKEEVNIKNYLYNEYDNLSIAKETLKKLNYKFENKIVPYKIDNYNIIISMVTVKPENINKWRNFIKKGKRLILFYNRIKKNNSFEEKIINFNYNEIKIKSSNLLLEDVDNLYINNNTIYEDDKKIFKKKTENILTVNNNIKIVKEKINGGEIIYICDPNIFSNTSIIENDNIILLNNLLKNYIKDTIIFDYVMEEKQYETNEEKSKYFLFMSKFPFLLLQLLIITIIFFLTFIKRFGPPLDKDKFERRSLIRHLDAVGNFFEKSKNKSVFIKILDKYFLLRLNELIKIRYSSKNNIINEVKKRFDIEKNEEDIFLFNNANSIILREIKREKFIRKLKGHK